MSLPAAVLWDMDGTLVDTEPYWIAAEHDIVEEHGGEMNFSSVEGGGTRVSLRFARDPHGMARDTSEHSTEDKAGS